jgi:hypothetical protein
VSLKKLFKQTAAGSVTSRFRPMARIEMSLSNSKTKIEPIVFECENEQGSKLGVFEDDGTTGYLYLVDPVTRQPEAAC